MNPKSKFKKWLRQLRKNDEKAFVKIYDEFWESLFAVGYNRINNKEVVEDIVQDIFCDLWRRRGNLNVNKSLKGYLHTALKYKVIDYYRRAAVQNNSVRLPITPQVSENTTENILSFNELYDNLQKGIESLPERCKLVYKMSRVDNKSTSEIADELNISKRTVETQIHKSVQILKRHLSD